MNRVLFLILSLSFLVSNASAQSTKPQYGGTLRVTTWAPTLSALSWDPQEWHWKLNQDTSLYLEQLFAGDLDKSLRKGGKHRFVSDAWLPSDAIRGELAEKWLWEDSNTLVVSLRKGVMVPEKAGVTKAREFGAEDVLFSYERLDKSAKKIPTYFDHIAKVEARDRNTVVFRFKDFFAEWDYRFGWGYYSLLMPKEYAAIDARDWKNAVGTGPFQLVEFINGNSQTYAKNPNYWDKEAIGGAEYKLPFVDRFVYRTIKDEATQHTALRTAQIDILELVRWTAVDELKKSAPQLKWAKRLASAGHILALRTDRKPFDDVRVRRAINMAVNKQEIVKSYYGGNAELFAYPMHPDYFGYYEPLEKMPASVKELYTYDPAKAKKLLAEAGYPNGFSFKAQVATSNFEHMELLPLIAGYLEKVGVKLEIVPMEYPAYLAAMTSKKHESGYLLQRTHTNPTAGLRSSFYTGQTWNPSMWSDPAFDKRIDELYRTREEAKRQQIVREMTAKIVDKAPYLWLPVPYLYSAWWPWVQNYGGELWVGALRPGPIYARIWIDQDMKKKMGL
ncbi:MAG: ABC transporter substrate-binding protein [Burkholderiales bacterium]